MKKKGLFTGLLFSFSLLGILFSGCNKDSSDKYYEPQTVTNLEHTIEQNNGQNVIIFNWTNPSDEYDHVEISIDGEPRIQISKGTNSYQIPYKNNISVFFYTLYPDGSSSVYVEEAHDTENETGKCSKCGFVKIEDPKSVINLSHRVEEKDGELFIIFTWEQQNDSHDSFQAGTGVDEINLPKNQTSYEIPYADAVEFRISTKSSSGETSDFVYDVHDTYNNSVECEICGYLKTDDSSDEDSEKTQIVKNLSHAVEIRNGQKIIVFSWKNPEDDYDHVSVSIMGGSEKSLEKGVTTYEIPYAEYTIASFITYYADGSFSSSVSEEHEINSEGKCEKCGYENTENSRFVTIPVKPVEDIAAIRNLKYTIDDNGVARFTWTNPDFEGFKGSKLYYALKTVTNDETESLLLNKSVNSFEIPFEKIESANEQYLSFKICAVHEIYQELYSNEKIVKYQFRDDYVLPEITDIKLDVNDQNLIVFSYKTPADESHVEKICWKLYQDNNEVKSYFITPEFTQTNYPAMPGEHEWYLEMWTENVYGAKSAVTKSPVLKTYGSIIEYPFETIHLIPSAEIDSNEKTITVSVPENVRIREVKCKSDNTTVVPENGIYAYKVNSCGTYTFTVTDDCNRTVEGSIEITDVVDSSITSFKTDRTRLVKDSDDGDNNTDNNTEVTFTAYLSYPSLIKSETARVIVNNAVIKEIPLNKINASGEIKFSVPQSDIVSHLGNNIGKNIHNVEVKIAIPYKDASIESSVNLKYSDKTSITSASLKDGEYYSQNSIKKGLIDSVKLDIEAELIDVMENCYVQLEKNGIEVPDTKKILAQSDFVDNKFSVTISLPEEKGFYDLKIYLNGKVAESLPIVIWPSPEFSKFEKVITGTEKYNNLHYPKNGQWYQVMRDSGNKIVLEGKNFTLDGKTDGNNTYKKDLIDKNDFVVSASPGVINTSFSGAENGLKWVYGSADSEEDQLIIYLNDNLPEGEYSVTVTYKDISISSVFKKIKASLGDVILEDGTIIPKADAMKLPEKTAVINGQKIAGVLFAVDLYGNPLALAGMHNTRTECDTNLYVNGTHSFVVEDGETGNASYSAAETYAENYGTKMSLTGKFASGWRIPTGEEMYSFGVNAKEVNEVLKHLGGDEIISAGYSSVQYVDYWTSSYTDNNDNSRIAGRIVPADDNSYKFDSILYSADTCNFICVVYDCLPDTWNSGE